MEASSGNSALTKMLRFVFGPHTFEVVAFFLAALGVAFALAPEREDVMKAHWFFGAAFLLSLGRVAHLLVTWKENGASRYAVSFILFGAIGVGWVITYDWVRTKVERTSVHLDPSTISAPQTAPSAATLERKPAEPKQVSGTFPEHHVGEGFIQIYPTTKDTKTFLIENEKTVFVANYVNKGQEPVNFFLPFASFLAIGELTNVPDMTSKAVWNKFHEQRREYEVRHPERKGISVGPGDNWQIQVDSGASLNGPTIDAIRLGRIKLLLLAWAEWKTRDGIKGEIESCFVLTPPEEKNPANLTWSSCDSL